MQKISESLLLTNFFNFCLYNVNSTSRHYAWMADKRKSYPSDEEWGFCVPYLALMTENAPQRDHPLRELLNGVRWFVGAGCPWRMIPHLPRVSANPAPWIKAGCFE